MECYHHPCLQDLTLVHALAATKDGADLYVADLAPGKLLKFSRQGSKHSFSRT